MSPFMEILESRTLDGRWVHIVELTWIVGILNTAGYEIEKPRIRKFPSEINMAGRYCSVIQKKGEVV